MLFKKKDKKLKGKKKARFVKICPRCHSINVRVSNSGGSAGVIFGAPTIYKCMNCGYSNYAFPEIDINEAEEENDKT
jgi:transposase-like protein